MMVTHGHLAGALSRGMWRCSRINLIVDIIAGIISTTIGTKAQVIQNPILVSAKFIQYITGFAPSNQ